MESGSVYGAYDFQIFERRDSHEKKKEGPVAAA